ncbi:hypothetical protein CXB51_009240 [Gossypium anomalum]|uniref:Uncharacterized protein n=1 Tax=Gossypium anomalum TaxID=47600 RepID=A0A8J5YUG8_9ROSI|nr:hypothetical protein CXB51_009240 [Gossypium anomalum]
MDAKCADPGLCGSGQIRIALYDPPPWLTMDSSAVLHAHATNGDRCYARRAPSTFFEWVRGRNLPDLQHRKERRGPSAPFSPSRPMAKPQGFGDLQIGERMPEHTLNSKSKVSDGPQRRVEQPWQRRGGRGEANGSTAACLGARAAAVFSSLQRARVLLKCFV